MPIMSFRNSPYFPCVNFALYKLVPLNEVTVLKLFGLSVPLHSEVLNTPKEPLFMWTIGYIY